MLPGKMKAEGLVRNKLKTWLLDKPPDTVEEFITKIRAMFLILWLTLSLQPMGSTWIPNNSDVL